MSDAERAAATEPNVRWPQVTGQAAAELVGCSAPWLHKLELDGYFERKENKLFDLGEVLFGLIRFHKEAERRAAKTAPARGLLEAQIRKLEIDNAKRLDSLVETEMAEQLADVMMDVLKKVFLNLEPLPNHPEITAEMDQRMRNALERADLQFADFFAGIRARAPSAPIDEL